MFRNFFSKKLSLETYKRYFLITMYPNKSVQTITVQLNKFPTRYLHVSKTLPIFPEVSFMLSPIITYLQRNSNTIQ